VDAVYPSGEQIEAHPVEAPTSGKGRRLSVFRSLMAKS
jgi:hypothetical protein